MFPMRGCVQTRARAVNKARAVYIYVGPNAGTPRCERDLRGRPTDQVKNRCCIQNVAVCPSWTSIKLKFYCAPRLHRQYYYYIHIVDRLHSFFIYVYIYIINGG